MILSSTSYLVLASLQDGPLHGYAIRQWTIDATPGERPTPVATLYATIDRLAADALVELESEEIVDGRARRAYRLTKSGRLSLLAESERLASAASLVKRVPVRRVKPAMAR
jgi:PadR family transcriptional regulator, regulatory protein PadR